MKIRKIRLSLIVAVFTLIISVSLLSAFAPSQLLSDHPFLKSLFNKMEAHQEQIRDEKVYVHLDKTLYKPGESIWLSAYVRDAKTLKASRQSDIVYVELLNPKGAVVKDITLIARNGQAAGDFQLPESIKGGQYKLKAYTKWQQNSKTYFERDISVQAVVLPNLNMKLDFERDAYGPASTASAQLVLSSLDKQALGDHPFKYVFSLDGKVIFKGSGKTDAQGLANLSFNLPQDLNSNDGLLNVMFKYKGQTESISRSVPIVLGNIDLQFFPEGGEAVLGQQGTMAFKAVDEFGKAADVSGDIIDEKGHRICGFRSYHQGMGRFEFRPEAGKTYSARLTQPSSAKGTYPLPEASSTAMTLRLRGQNKQQIQLDVLSPQKEELFVVAQSNGQILFSTAIDAYPGPNSLSIPTSSFPVGITQITLFDANKVARAERLAFVNPHKKLHINIKTNKEKYLPRELVKMDINVTNEYGRPVSGQFSMAVVDDKLLTFADDKQGHILGYTLLESDLSGTIDEPNFYFDDENDPTRFKPQVDRSTALDNLMMTQGWRKFEWKDIQEENHPAMVHQPEKAIFAGKVTNLKGEAVEGADVQITGMASVKTDKDGNFLLDHVDMYQALSISVSGKDLYPQSRTLYDYAEQLNFKVVGKRVLTGVVKDAKTKKALPNASVQIYGGSQHVSVRADQNGKYKIEFPENATHIYAYYGGYNKSVDLRKNKGENLNILVPYQEYLNKRRSSRSKSAKGGRVLRNAPTNAVLDMPVEELRMAEDVDMGGFNELAAPLPPPPPPPAPEAEKQLELLPMDFVEKAEVELEEVEEQIAFGDLEDEWDVLDQDKHAEQKDRRLRAKKEIQKRRAIRYYRARSFYAPKYEQKKQPAVRNDFRSTIYWNPQLRTDKRGKATVQFYNSDDITQFRVTVEGFGNHGEIGRQEHKFFVQMPVEVITKIPTEVLSGDKLFLPITLTNNSAEQVSGTLSVSLPEHLTLIQQPAKSITLAAGEGKTLLLKAQASAKAAEGSLSIAFDAQGLRDQVSVKVNTRPRGFPVRALYSGDQLRSSFALNLNHPIQGTVNASVRAFPSSLDQVMEGMASMLRMPGGCFEQTSSSNYPNLLALNYMRETNTSNPDLEKKARQYLKAGYGRLTGYESKSGGFDWWGRDPAHEALTAYGLMQFIDMKSVFPVDEALINRTTNWLMKRRDGKGSWQKNAHCLHSWATSEITDAYIVWALTEANMSKDIKKELDKSYNDAVKSEDPYLMGLVVNALYNAKDKRADELMRELIKTQKTDGSFMGLKASVVNSRGNSLKVETTALAALAMMKTKGYNKELSKAVSTIQGSKGYYGYGSTQGTVLALKAILGYTKMSKRAAEDGVLAVLVNGKKVISVAYKADQKDIEVPDLTPFLSNGKQKVEVKFEKTNSAMPFEVELTYNTRMPNNSKNCALGLATTLPQTKVNMGETVRLSTALSSTSKENQPMAIAMIGIPAGLSVQLWQLKELQDKKVFDFYEIFDGYVVLHYELLKPGEIKSVNLDLKADIPGEYEAPASCAFLYYTNEHRIWSKPENVFIN